MKGHLSQHLVEPSHRRFLFLSLFYFSFLSIYSSSSLRQLGSCISGKDHLHLLGLFLFSCPFPLLWLPVLLFRMLLPVLLLSPISYAPLLLDQVCKIFCLWCEYPFRLPPSLSGWTEQTAFEDEFVSSWRRDYRRTDSSHHDYETLNGHSHGVDKQRSPSPKRDLPHDQLG